MFSASKTSGPSGYNLTNSLRFRSSASAFLNRTPSVTGNLTTWTWSGWVKLGALSTDRTLFGAASSGNAQLANIHIAAANSFEIDILDANSTRTIRGTTAVYRDPSAWYHVVFILDTTQATAANRMRLYINGNQIALDVAAVGTYPAQNANCIVNSTSGVHNIGRRPQSNDRYLDGYMTDINFIDGQALTPSSFGSTNATTGVWQPAKYTGTYGNNGFYLNFSSIALTSGSNTGLGKDNSGNGNYWNTNNISVTAGTTYDAMTDVPTNTSATVANYPVYDQLTPSKVSGSGVRSISAANLYVTNSGPNGWSTIGTTMVMTSGSGKWYWEVTCSGTTSNGSMIGIHRPFTSTSTFPSAILGYDTPADPDGYGYYMGGNKYNNSGAGVAYGASYTAGDVIGVALDMSTAGSASITFYKNNTSQGVAFSSLTGDFFAAVSQAQANGLDINFGQRPFTYTPPTGFVRLNTFNLPTPTILQGNKYMDATLYTGTGATQVVTNSGSMKPDLVWLKSRSVARDHRLMDTVRGINLGLQSNITNAEFTGTALSSINSNGFTLNTTDNQNVSAETYVGWQWQAGQGSTSSNTQGSITSTVSVNATAGFSVVTYTGTGANATVGHGLGVAPKIAFFKRRNSTSDWSVYFNIDGLGAGVRYLLLNGTGGSVFDTTYWNSTAATSSVLSLGTAGNVNTSSGTMVAYCWAEIAGFSKFGSYTGNGSTDGVFVYLGFRPKFIITKVYSTSGYNWNMYDSSRGTYNENSNVLIANGSGVEETGFDPIDFLSNGFKLRMGNRGSNVSGASYIYMAFAENPFKNALAR